MQPRKGGWFTEGEEKVGGAQRRSTGGARGNLGRRRGGGGKMGPRESQSVFGLT